MHTTWTSRCLTLSAPALLSTLPALLPALPACGARSTLEAPPPDGGVSPSTPGQPEDPEGGVPNCPIECYVGHGCCLGGCGGPALVEDTCCTCPSGSVSTFDCGEATCGG